MESLVFGIFLHCFNHPSLIALILKNCSIYELLQTFPLFRINLCCIIIKFCCLQSNMPLFKLSYTGLSLLCVNLSFSLSILAERLQQPSIQIVTSTSVESGCLMVVNCSSLDEGVNLSWSVEPVSVLTINKSHPSDSSAQLFAFVNTKENFASFTCISSRDTESVSSKPVTPKCESKICGKLLNVTLSLTYKHS